MFLSLNICLYSEEIFGIVTKVYDGDTITITDNLEVESHKVRLAYIDAPEKKQIGGTESRNFLADLVLHKFVRIDVKTIDKYGRIVGEVWYGEEMINERMVKYGFAFVYQKYFKKHEKEFMNKLLKYEEDNIKNKKGIFAYDYKETPEDFRKKK